MKNYWLFKSEPESYSIDDLKKDGATHWDGIRNYQARNLLRDEIKKGDEVLVYHSNANPPGVAGLARVVREGYPDPAARDPESHYYDEKASEEDPRWFMVDIEFVKKFDNFVPLPDLKEKKGLEEMVVTKRSRLSVQPVRKEEFEIVKGMAEGR